MPLPSDWKIGKFLEWYTEFPFLERPRESAAFFIKNIECIFLFCRNTDKYYTIHLKPKTTRTRLEPFPIIIYSNYSGYSSFNRSCVNFSDSSTPIYCFHESHVPNGGPNFSHGYFARFFFVFDGSNGPSLPVKTEMDAKATQTNSILSLEADIEYLCSDLGELIKSGDHADVQLQCNGGNIAVHKAILSSRSKAFADMFKEDTAESKSGLVDFSTTEMPVMQLCLEYIYKGKISNLPVEMAPKLYVLGHVLKIPSLTKLCADLMVCNSSKDNYIPYLVLANEHDDDYFKSGIIDYISDHVDMLKKRKVDEISK